MKRLFISLTLAHFLLTFAALIFGLTYEAMDDGEEYKPSIFSTVASRVADVLLMPASSLKERVVTSDALEWLLVALNSMMWALVVTSLAAFGHAWKRTRTGTI
jgi:hypothetical protein